MNTTFCGPARDTVLTNRQAEKLNFDTNNITITTITNIRQRILPIIKELLNEVEHDMKNYQAIEVCVKNEVEDIKNYQTLDLM